MRNPKQSGLSGTTAKDPKQAWTCKQKKGTHQNRMPADSIKCLPRFTSRMMCNFLWELKYNFITLYGNSRILKRNRLIWPAGPVDDREQRQLKIYCRKNKESNTCPIKLRWSDCRWDETAPTYKRWTMFHETFTFYDLAWVPYQIIIHLWTWISETLYL